MKLEDASKKTVEAVAKDGLDIYSKHIQINGKWYLISVEEEPDYCDHDFEILEQVKIRRFFTLYNQFTMKCKLCGEIDIRRKEIYEMR